MFFILPFEDNLDLSTESLDDFLIRLFSKDTELDVIDSTDMVVESVKASVIEKLLKEKKVKFPQLELYKGYAYLSEQGFEITSGVSNKVVFTDSRNNQKIKITKSNKSFNSYNDLFDEYIRKFNIKLEEDCYEYTACTFAVKGSNTTFTLEVTIQGICDTFGEPICSGLFVNKKFICYLSTDFCFSDGEVDVEVVQFYREDFGYVLTLLAPNTNQFFSVTMSPVLRRIGYRGLDKLVVNI